jgi:hypothetical protein
MKRKYGAALARETIAEENMRKAAQAKKDNRFNFGAKANKGSPTRGKRRGLAYKPSYAR